MRIKLALIAVFAVFSAPVARAAGKPVSIKELLSDVPAADRAAFAGGILVGDGVVLSADFKPLKNLTEARQIEIKNAFAPKAPPKGKKGKRGKPGRLAELLDGVPKAAADEFLDGLLFVDGRIVGASSGALKKAVTPERYKEILDSLAAPGTKPPAGMKGVCGNGWCDDSWCTSLNTERRHCAPHDDSTCYSFCR